MRMRHVGLHVKDVSWSVLKQLRKEGANLAGRAMPLRTLGWTSKSCNL